MIFFPLCRNRKQIHIVKTEHGNKHELRAAKSSLWPIDFLSSL